MLRILYCLASFVFCGGDVSRLGSADFNTRELAHEAMAERDWLARPVLKKAASRSHDLEVRRRAQRILRRQDGFRLPDGDWPPILTLLTKPEDYYCPVNRLVTHYLTGRGVNSVTFSEADQRRATEYLIRDALDLGVPKPILQAFIDGMARTRAAAVAEHREWKP